MKKTTRIVAALLLIAVLCTSLASCGKKLSGKYSADFLGTGTTLTFDGKDVKIGITVTFLGEVASLDATYEIKNDKISFDIANDDEVTNETAKQVIAALEAPSAFEEGEDYIKIGDTTYRKISD